MFDLPLIVKFGADGSKELITLTDSLINRSCFDLLDKLAIIKLLERYCSLDANKIRASLFVLTAHSVFPLESQMVIQEKLETITVERAAKIVFSMSPVQQALFKALSLVFREVAPENTNEKLFMDSMIKMLCI